MSHRPRMEVDNGQSQKEYIIKATAVIYTTYHVYYTELIIFKLQWKIHEENFLCGTAVPRDDWCS
jgi:hypothetical protein